MLNPFPNLLMFGFYAPMILRFAVALIVAYLAYTHFKNKDSIARIKFPVISGGAWVVWLTIAVEIFTAAALFFGYYTQYAAILGILIGLKQFVWRNAYPKFFVLPRTASFFLIAILASLLLTGAGALAFDLPL